ncbi:gtrA-like protein [Clostridium sp. CAG:43]|nr:gtrA-like protein [Clostridium sp. CAG:43]
MSKLLNQLVKFVGLSGIGWLLDFFTYTILGFVSNNLVLNNSISSWVGVTFVFAFATRKIFQSNSRIPLTWKYVIYILYQIVLIYFISKVLNGINLLIISKCTLDIILRFSSILAKILVTPITMILNFIVMKGVVEKL